MPNNAWLALLFSLPFAAAGAAAQPPSRPAQPGIDCAKARSPTEKAICATPGLLALDAQVAAAYAGAAARQPDGRDRLRTEQLRWLRERDAACALPAPAIPACLRAQFDARLAALADPTPTPVASTPAGQPPPRRPDPSIPATDLPQGAARLEPASLPAAPDGETLLHVTVAGRFTLAAHGPGGTALQLVDMLTGPSAVAGAAGSQDGRLDRLLDVGTYKLRVFSAPGASGTVALSATPFRQAAPPAALPQPGQPLAATLRDGEERSFWLLVPPSGAVRIDAAGRSLADLRLWRNGRELDALEPEVALVEPVPGHPLSRLTLNGKVEPGTYRVVAYGGPPATWTDGDAAQPFLLRAGASDALAAGWAGGTVGPFGSEAFAVPPGGALLRLTLPRPAAAVLSAGGEVATIGRDSREPVASLSVAPGGQPVVEVRAAAGQAFTLRALEQAGRMTLERPGTWWVSAAVTGAGGDEVPPTVLLQRADRTGKPPRIVADNLPVIGPAKGWRARFNLRGSTQLLTRSEGGAVTLRTTGVPVRGGRVDANLPDGFYAASLQPQSGALGAVELVLGPPGINPPPAAAVPADPVVPFGIQSLQPGERLELVGGSAPGERLNLTARAVPVALAEGPLLVTLPAGQAMEVPVLLAPGGTLGVSEVGSGPAPFTRREENGRSVIALPAQDVARTVSLAWLPVPSVPATIPAPAPEAAAPTVQAGTPVFFDLGDQVRSFDLSVSQGGLFRVETLGRLHTAGQLGTAFIPKLGEGDANGIGQNMLIQTTLRAGHYQVRISAADSAGRAGLLATPAPLLQTGALRPGGSVRATLPGGTGAAVPVLVEAATPLHLDVAGLGEPWQGRLEDEAGWPLTPPGPLDGLSRTLQPGRYRVVVNPVAVTRQLVLRLRPDLPPPVIEGHGPHPLPFGTPMAATWREPDSANASRTPDRWTFALEGRATVTLTLPDTMVGELRRAGSDEAPRRVVRRFSGTLEAGAYELAVTSLGRNDRAPYRVSLTSTELQPGVSRSVTLPATLPFALAAPRVVSLTSFGTTPVRAVLRDADGTVLGRFEPRQDDWNVAVTRPLPAGRYTLDLLAAGAPASVATSRRDGPAAPDASSSDADESTGDRTGDSAATTDDQPAQTRSSQVADTPSLRPARDVTPSDDASGDGTSADEAPAPKVEVRLALPEPLPAVPAPEVAATLPGSGVHLLDLPPATGDGLVLAQAEGAAAVALALERQGPAGWDLVVVDGGRTPLVASPTSGAATWRVRAWTVDGGPDPIRLAARVIDPAPQEVGTPALAPLADMPAPLAVARVRTTPGLLRLGADAEGLRVGSWPGQALRPIGGGTVLPVPAEAWLLGRAGPVNAAAFLPADGEGVALTIPAGIAVALPEGTGPALWLARSGSGQPSLGAGSGWAPGGAAALAGSAVQLRDGGTASLRVDLRRAPLRLLPEVSDATIHAVLPPGAALPVRLAPGAKQLDMQLSPDTAAVPDGPAATVWAGDAAVSRKIFGEWTRVLLANAGTEPAAVSLAAIPMADAPVPLGAGGVLKRFFGAAGSFEVAVAGGRGAVLHLAGPARLTVVATDGAVAEGRAVQVPGPARAIVRHEAGAVVLWAEAPNAPAWPAAAAQAVSLPARLVLGGEAVAFRWDNPTPVLLHATTTAPVLLAAGVAAPEVFAPEVFASGAEWHRVLPAGTAELRLFPPQDGALTGSLSLWAEPIRPVTEGLGPETAVPPGGGAAFGFTLAKAGTIGVGVRAEPDRAAVRLLAADGSVVGQGVAELVTLPAGSYVLEARVPPDAPPVVLRPAVVGIAPRPTGPPPDVVSQYLQLAGIKPQETAP